MNRHTTNSLLLLTLISLASPSVWAAGFACESTQSGLWSDSLTWTNCDSSIPNDEATVTIKSGHIVTLDIDTNELDSITTEAGSEFNVANNTSGASFTLSGSSNAGDIFDLSNASILLSENLIIDANEKIIKLGSIVGNFGLTINSAQLTQFTDVIGGTTPLASVNTDVDGTLQIDNDVTVSGLMNFLEPITLGANSVLTATTVILDSTIDNGGFDLTVNSSSVAELTLINGVISGSGDLIKQGVGDLSLAAVNTYTGSTFIQAGEINLLDVTDNNSISKSKEVEISSGATLNAPNQLVYSVKSTKYLSGSGILSSGLQALSNSRIYPGGSSDIGILSASSTYLWGNSKFYIEIGGPTAGTEYDQLSVTGELEIGEATLNLTESFSSIVGDQFTIIENDGTDVILGMFDDLPEGSLVTAGTSRYSISYIGGDGNDVVLTNASCQSIQDGLWSESTTWTGCDGSIPQLTDNVEILHFVSLDMDATIAAIEGSGNFNVLTGGRTLTVTDGDADFNMMHINLGGDFTINNTNHEILFQSIDGTLNNEVLTLNSNQDVSFTGDNSTTIGLGAIVTDAGGRTRIKNPRTFKLTGNSGTIFNDALVIGPSAKIVFNQSGTGNVVFNDEISIQSGGSKSITIYNDLGQTEFNGIISIGELVTHGTANVVFSGGSVTTTSGSSNSGIMVFNSPVIIADDTVFSAVGNGYIEFNGSINDDTNSGTSSIVTINSSTTTQLSSIGNSSPIDSLTTDASGTTTMNADVSTLVSMIFNDAIILGSDIQLSSAVVDFNSTIDNAGFDLTINNNSKGTEESNIVGVLSGSGDFIGKGNKDIHFFSVNTISGNLIISEGPITNQTETTNIFPNVPVISIAENAFANLGSSTSNEFRLANNQVLNGAGECDCYLIAESGSEVSPGLSPGELTIETITLNTGSKLRIELNGVSPSIDYDQISTVGLNLDGDSNGGGTLDLSLGYEPAINDSFTIVKFDDVFPVSNHFNGLPEGAELSADGTLFSITYSGGDGNDVVLTALGSSILYVNQNVATAGDGSSWANAFDNLQDALAVATMGMEIWVAQGIYYPDVGATQTDNDSGSTFTLITGVSIYGGFNGTETDITQRDPASNTTVLSGDIDNNDTVNANGTTVSHVDLVGTNAYHLLTASGTDFSNVIDGFTLTAGRASSKDSIDRKGSVINCNNDSITLNYLIVQGNFVKNEAILGSCNSHVNNSLFINNYSDDIGTISTGGGIYSDVVFTGNEASEQASIFYLDDQSLTLNRVSFTNNFTQNYNGVIRASGGELNLNDVLFSGNKTNVQGGAMDLSGTLNGAFNNVTITGNYAAAESGGIKSDISGTLEINNSIVWNNEDASGLGTIDSSIVHSGTGTITIKSSILQGSGGSTAWIPATLIDGSGNLDEDPLFITETDPSSAPTDAGNLRLNTGSSAINTGDNALIRSGFDLDGQARITNNTVDMGAYEYVGYRLNVAVVGLDAGTLVVQNNGINNLIFENSLFETFTQQIANTAQYSVAVVSQPSSPNQFCEVIDGSGVVDNADVTINVICTTLQYNVGVDVTGLAEGVTLSLQNISESLDITESGQFNFATALDDETSYVVSIKSQPSSPNQECLITSDNANGMLDGMDVIVEIECTTLQYTVGVNVAGLASGNTVEFDNNGESLIVSTDGQFNFNTALDDSSSYNVIVINQPQMPNQMCTIESGNGMLQGEDVLLTVTCSTDQYFVGGIASGLANGNSVTLSLGAEDLSVSSNNAFVFLNPLTDESAYSVSITNQPTVPNQTCQMVNPTGTIAGDDVDNMQVNCTTNQYTVGGTVTGLHSGNNLVIQNNESDDLTISNDGDFDFNGTIEDLQSYDVSILNQPTNPIQTCALSQNSGNVAGIDVVTVMIDCDFGDDLIYKDGFELNQENTIENEFIN